MRRSAALAAAVAAVALIAPVQADTDLVTVYELNGTVTDGAGRALEGVTVSDGTRTTTTDADGQYRLGQALPGPKAISFSRSDLVARTGETVVALPLGDDATRLDAVMRYRLEMEVTNPDVSVATAAKTVNVTLRSWAPESDAACLTLQDTATNRARTPARSGTATAPLTYTYGISVAKGAADATHEALARHQACFPLSGMLTDAVRQAFRVDSSKPTIGSVSLRAVDGERRIVVATQDQGPSGVASVSLAVTDKVTKAVHNGTATYDPDTGEAVSDDPFTVPAGRQFSVVVTVTDRAGNSQAKTFLGTS